MPLLAPTSWAPSLSASFVLAAVSAFVESDGERRQRDNHRGTDRLD